MTHITLQPTAAGTLSASQIYDWFMSQVEPDLVTANVERISEMYKDESAAQTQARGERYRKALEEFREFFDVVLLQLKDVSRSEKMQQLTTLESDSRTLEGQKLDLLESMFA